MAPKKIELSAYDPRWPGAFSQLGGGIRAAVGEGPRIHHIGSTSVPQLAAKPIIDIQISVDDWDDFDRLRVALEGHAFVWQSDNDDRRKRFFKLERKGVRVSNLHVRRWAEFSSQAALLFRDYLRADASARQRYEAEKRRLALQTWPTVDHYADAKSDVVWSLIRAADRWSWGVAWEPGPSDA